MQARIRPFETPGYSFGGLVDHIDRGEEIDIVIVHGRIWTLQ